MKSTAAPEKGGPRVNRDIRAVQVQLIDGEGQNRGVVNLADAQKLAEESGLDLVEIVPNASPPVCKILDFGKYRFLEQKKSAEQRKRQKIVEIKEIKLRPGIDDHDYDVKMRSVFRFFEEGDKVKVTLALPRPRNGAPGHRLPPAAEGQERDGRGRQGRGRAADGRPADGDGARAEVMRTRLCLDAGFALRRWHVSADAALAPRRCRRARPIPEGYHEPCRTFERAESARPSARVRRAARRRRIGILFAVSASHMLNDMMQSLAPALYPVFRDQYSLTFFQTGIITLVFQITASLLQPLIGLVTDRRPAPRALPFAMGFTLIGLVLLAFSSSYRDAAGLGRPDRRRQRRVSPGSVARGARGVGRQARLRAEPVPGRRQFRPVAGAADGGVHRRCRTGRPPCSRSRRWPSSPSCCWPRRAMADRACRASRARRSRRPPGERLPRAVVWRSLAILVVLLFSKTFYLASLNSYYTFYLIQTFDVSVQTAQVLLFVFLGAVAAGTFAGGPIGDRIGRKYVIWVSILGVLPFTLLLPHLGLVGTVIDSVAIGLILSSAFSAMVVYAQELAPGNVGAIAGLFFGLSFGLGGLGAAALGLVADHTSLTFVYKLCAYLPAIGLLTYFLPDVRRRA